MVKFRKLIQKLKKKKLKISFAESCTGGLLAHSITSISGASKVFSLSVVTYSNDSKNSITVSCLSSSTLALLRAIHSISVEIKFATTVSNFFLTL